MTELDRKAARTKFCREPLRIIVTDVNMMAMKDTGTGRAVPDRSKGEEKRWFRQG